VWQVALGIYLICLGINYVPMLANTVLIGNKQNAEALRHSLLTGVKRLRASHDCFGIGAYHEKLRHRGAERLALREIEVVSSVIIATLLCI
jgi:hypothetical protein